MDEVWELDERLGELRSERDNINIQSTLKLLTADSAPPEDGPTDQIPSGVHPGNHQLDRRVRERLRELDRPEGDYVKTLDEVLREL